MPVKNTLKQGPVQRVHGRIRLGLILPVIEHEECDVNKDMGQCRGWGAEQDLHEWLPDARILPCIHETCAFVEWKDNTDAELDTS